MTQFYATSSWILGKNLKIFRLCSALVEMNILFTLKYTSSVTFQITSIHSESTEQTEKIMI